MSEQSDRYRKVSAGFTRRVDEVPAGAWDNPAPVEGWATRDVVGHLVEWLPAFFFEKWSIPNPDHPSVGDDPAGAWKVIQQTFQDALDDPAIAEQVQEDPRMGPMTFAACFDMIGTNDIFLHTWDLARAAGLDETLDPDEVHRLFVDMEPMDEMLRASGQYGPRVPVPDDADEQTKLIAFIGRQP
jgi:uncharacterized protein (TIGR03086 family)